MCITGNLDKNKWLGYLILASFMGIFHPVWPAFSKSEAPRDVAAGKRST
jgi:hypothetical protein